MAKHLVHPWLASRLTRGLAVGLALAIAAGIGGLSGCDLGSHTVLDGGGPPSLTPSTACSGACHGAGDGTAPPFDTLGRSNVSAIGVGAHTQHLQASTWHKRFDCVTCHTVPQNVGDLGHITKLGADGVTKINDPLPAEVIFSSLGVGASWDHASATCTNSYCHGDTLHQIDYTTNMVTAGAGGTLTQPVWTTVDGSQSKCGSCHGLPPPAPHPQNATDCGLCHQSMNPGDFAAGKISYPELHIDGKVEVASTQPCNTCHGTTPDGTPPKDAHNNNATTAAGVGAHAQHMTATSPWHAPIQCNECHLVPISVTDQTHIDQIDEVYLDPTVIPPGSPTGTGGHLQIPGATWNANALTCSNTYCHGGGVSPLKGGTTITPKWTQVDGTQSQCQSCHGMPPPAPHPVDSDCGKCHPTMTAGGSNTTVTYPAKHIDGNVDVINDQPCNTCHGNPAGTPVPGDAPVNAPPNDTMGQSSTGLRSVGAHQSHLMASSWRAPMPCGECHVVPTSLLSIGHIDHPLPAIIKFGNLAGATATWNGSTCSNVYCHGATLTEGGGPAGGTATKPVWTTVNGSQSQCGSCHGLPPPTPHPQDLDCGKCHNTVAATGNGTTGVITDPSRHINGAVDVSSDQPCNFCHGSAGTPTMNGAPINAPPKDTLGNSMTTARGVGAHQAHLAPASPMAKPVVCSDCHTVFSAVNSVGHIDHPLPATVIFSSRAGSAPAWNGATCTNTYCHGATLVDPNPSGTAGETPIWGKVDGSQLTCTSCHGNPPGAPHPQPAADCGTCHSDVKAGSPTVFLDTTRHIDGTVDVVDTQKCNACHGDHTSMPASNSDKVNAPPFDSTGTGSSTGLRGVGAHQKHLTTGSAWHGDLTCGTCHVVPANYSSAGHVDHALPAIMAFTGVGAGTTWNGANCSSYCHGSTLTLDSGTATNPNWTLVDGTQTQCTSCHGNPPPASQGHPNPAPDCGTCHSDVKAGSPTVFVTPAMHIIGTVDVTAGTQHPTGYQMVTMHGYDVDKKGLSTCSTSNCHGTALTGGSTGGPSCATVTGCHDQVKAGYSWQTQCTFCHGDISNGAGNGAPGVPAGVGAGVLGATAATDPTVGSHSIHLAATATHAAWDCTMCHVKPTSALNPGHIDGTGGVVQAEVIFSSLNPSSAYSFTAYTCATNYCHGNGQSGQVATSPAWTSTTALTCTSCHGSPPSSGDHTGDHRNQKCAECHYTTTTNTTNNTTITNLAAHINGAREVVFRQGGTYTPSTKTCTGIACHGTQRW